MAVDIMSRVRSRLLVKHPFFGSLAMQLDLIEDTKIETLQTDGVVLRWNPEFMASLTPDEQEGVTAHEVEHCALLHVYRRGGRDPLEWNEAADYVINLDLLADGFVLPQGALVDQQWAGMSAEQVYSKRRQKKAEEKQSQGKPQDGKGTPSEGGSGVSGSSPLPQSKQVMPGCPTGDFVDGPVEGQDAVEGQMTETDWQLVVEQAAKVAKAQGSMPAGASLSIQGTREQKVDWVTECRDFIARTIANDYSWTSPSRRFIHMGVFLPGQVKENTGELVIGVDTSGSCLAIVSQFTAEMQSILREARPEKIHVVYCDAKVHGSEEFGPDDFETAVFKPKGGGGTRFQPVFDWVAEKGIEPAGLIYLTDLYGPVPIEPDYPVLWVTPEWSTQTAPFGRGVQFEERQ